MYYRFNWSEKQKKKKNKKKKKQKKLVYDPSIFFLPIVRYKAIPLLRFSFSCISDFPNASLGHAMSSSSVPWEGCYMLGFSETQLA